MLKNRLRRLERLVCDKGQSSDCLRRPEIEFVIVRRDATGQIVEIKEPMEGLIHAQEQTANA